MSPSRKPPRTLIPQRKRRFAWDSMLLVLACITLVLQLLPGGAWEIVTWIDPRDWTWRFYAGLFAVAIVVLIVLRGREQN